MQDLLVGLPNLKPKTRYLLVSVKWFRKEIRGLSHWICVSDHDDGDDHGHVNQT